MGSIAIASLLLSDTIRYVESLEIYPRRTSATDSILLGLLSKSIVTAQAVVSLCSNGFNDEAFGLCRTIVEIELIVRHFTQCDTVARVNRYFYYFAKDKVEWRRLAEKYYPNEKHAQIKDRERIERLASTFKTAHSWSSPLKLKDFAAETDRFETTENGIPLDELFYYEVIYKWMSHYVHATEPSLDPTHLTMPGEAFRVHPNPRGNHGEHAIRTAIANVGLNMNRIFRYFHMEVDSVLEQRFHDTAVSID